jgi:hypothetical protein
MQLTLIIRFYVYDRTYSNAFSFLFHYYYYLSYFHHRHHIGVMIIIVFTHSQHYTVI